MPAPTPTNDTRVAAPWAVLRAAPTARHTVEVSYHGRQRLVCPHALGRHNQRYLVLGYQVGGQTTTGTLDPDPRKRWRCMFIDEIVRHEAPLSPAVVKGHGRRLVAASRQKLRAA